MPKRLGLAIGVVVCLGCGGPELYEGMPPHVMARHVPLDGAANFRDLGGYATEDGRSVRWGMLYRSDHLGDLTDRDLDYLRGLGIRLVCDFRGDEEVESHPDRLPEDGSVRRINPSITNEAFSPGRIGA